MSYDRAEIDLTNCDREPIHIPGSIQPHGAMLVVDPSTSVVVHASANIGDYIDDIDAIVDRELSDILGPDVTHQINNAAARAGAGHVAGVVLGVTFTKSARRADITIHRFDRRLFLEFEVAASAGDTEIALGLTQSLVRRIDREVDADELVGSVSRLVRAMLGYDRVMVYRFLHNGAGRVVAESKQASMESFLGQHFPFSDIPAQARRLYLENWIRVIGDVAFEPIPLRPPLAAGEVPIDMSHAHLRSVSPIHCEYLQNMGVASSMSISIVVDGALWGLIACHHNTPKVLSIPLRVATELFAQYFSLQIGAAENRRQHLAANHARRRLDAIIATIDPNDAVDVTLRKRLREFASLVACDGAALWSGEEWTATGVVPQQEDVSALMSLVAEKADNNIWDTQELSLHLPQTGFGQEVAGVLAIPISASAGDYLLLFRSEEAHEIEWAGEPKKKVVSTLRGDRLSPRGSFETWREDVRNRSLPWTTDDVSVAEAIRNYVRDILLRHNDATEEQRARNEDQRRLLNAELNHRVKNILALVKSIAVQTGSNARSVDEFANSFEGRLRALSYAHDQSFDGRDGGELHALIEAEAAMHRFQQLPDRFTIDGPAVGLSERAFGVFALVLHEMMTNAAKYGSLSVPTGRLEVRWVLDEAGNCCIEWVESGGPPVMTPSRKGFGSTLIDRTVAFDLGGEAELVYAPDGLRARFILPARHLHEVVAARIEVHASNGESRPLADLRILLVEDQALIAMDVEEILRELGAAEVWSLPDVAQALGALADETPDCAVLDLNLGHETSEVIAAELVQRGIPFVFATGYRDSVSIPDGFSGVPVVRKPIAQDMLSRQLSLALSEPRDATA
ncbi:MAG: HWE histidine kinase domain-containing protein [Pantoea sp.]|uniref:HWE histidine kinase domain-containing protein n=1 Tax=Pantoea sp. TaxID=69393 RepID=UPI00239EEC92|nr:HWE histidine kinase domain-containing protein [Pantoea sp.]MDE1187863.1 HWE histidine kinase domain-containing protein [Pantoea sp.]